MNETIFHLIFVASFLAFTVIRMAARRYAQKNEGSVEYKEGRLHRGVRVGIGVPFMLALFVSMAFPSILDWADFALPEWARWLGAALLLGSLPLIVWIQISLGANFDTTLHVREKHTLVTHGPYRWVRHPMYTTLYLFELGILLLTANWFLGSIPLVALTWIVLTRTRREEAAMQEKFGDNYTHYMQRTGRFLPRV